MFKSTGADRLTNFQDKTIYTVRRNGKSGEFVIITTLNILGSDNDYVFFWVIT